MTIKEVVNRLKTELEGAGTTHLATATVYRGDKESWSATKAVFLIWTGMGENADSIGDGEAFSDIHSITVDIRQKAADPTAAQRDPDDWYDDFLEFYDEVKAELVTKETRRATSGSQHFNKLLIESVTAGYIGEGAERHYVAAMDIVVHVPQA